MEGNYSEKEWTQYYAACHALDSTLKQPSHHSELRDSVIRVYVEIKNLSHDPKNKIPPEKLTNILITIKEVLKGPDCSEDDAYRETLLDLQEEYNDLRSFPVAKFLGSAILFLLGTAIVAASGILAAVSFGLAAPVSLFGIVFGVSMITGGISIATGLLGASFLMFSGSLFSHAAHDTSLRKEMNDLKAKANRTPM